MIDLRNKSVIIRTQEEYKKILEEGRKQGFKWRNGDVLEVLEGYTAPTLLSFASDYTVTFRDSIDENIITACELLRTKELTASELIDFLVKCMRECNSDMCS